MAFQVYYNQFNNRSPSTSSPKPKKLSSRKSLKKLINRLTLPSIKEASTTRTDTTNKQTLPISLPKSIPFTRDEINQKWMQHKMRKFSDEYGFKISSMSSDDWLPTPHGITMADAISKTLSGFFTNKSVLELGGGVGNHTVLILKQNPKQLTVTERTDSRINVTKNTLKENDMLKRKNIRFMVGDWLHLKTLKEDKFDILVTNPPFAASGRRNRRYFIDELILNSWRYLKDNGHLVFIQSSMALIEQSVDRLKQNGYDDVNIVYATKYYWRDYYFKDESFIKEADEDKRNGYNSYEIDYENDNKRVETLYVVMARLKPWKGTSIQH